MKFSVVIPLYNGERVIKKTLDSVLAQTYKKYEIILVNDGSPDNVGRVVKEYIADHSEIEFKYIEQKNKGLGGARNTAIRNASGEIIAILDQDDIWYPQKLEQVARIYEGQPNADLVCHNCYLKKGGKISEAYVAGPFTENMFRTLLFCGNRLFTLTTTFRKAVSNRVGLFSEDVKYLHFAEDYDLWLRMAKAGCCFVFIPDYLAEYIQHENNCSLTSIERICKSEIYVVEKHYLELADKLPLDWYRLRKRKAKIFMMTAYRYLFYSKSIPMAFLYVIYALYNDPLFISTLIKGSVSKIIRLFIARGVGK